MKDIPPWLWTFYVLAASAELYYFMMQRTALEICRLCGLPEQLRHSITGRAYRHAGIAVGAKWLSVVLMVWYGSLWTGVAAWAVPFFGAAMLPIPRLYFVQMFERQCASSVNQLDSIAPTIRDALAEARRQLQTASAR